MLENVLLQPYYVLDEPDAQLLPGSCTQPITNMMGMELCSIHWVSSGGFASFDISHFEKHEPFPHPTGEMQHLLLLRVLQKVTSPLCSFMSTWRAWRSAGHVTTREILLLLTYSTSTPGFFWTLRSVLQWWQMTLGKYVLAIFSPQEQIGKNEIEMKN